MSLSDSHKPGSAAHGRGTSEQLLETLNTAVLVLDHRLLMVYLNPAAESLFEISQRQISGQYWPEVIRAGESLVERLIETLKTRHPFTERELELHTATGQRMTVDCVVTPSGKGDLLLEIMQIDRHLRIAHEEHLLVQQQAARELLRGMAHEIKNPLGGLRGAAQLLESELHNDELKEYTRVIIGEADRLTNLVDRMLGPNHVLENRIINIHQVLEHVRSLVDAESYPGLELLREYDPSIPDFPADSELLIQAVLNLVRNAAQAGAEKIILVSRTQRQFTIGHTRYKLVIRIDIVDDGPGIPAEMQEKIFYPMVTGRAGGTGLGLSIAQSMINQHQGIIEFTSEPGRTVFTLFLPLEVANG
ncbi:MAG: two-component system sensor histidine kinase NtrB [Gammaproteobacteria bacterium]|nr:MAG: two-component system sensor histidine kinase NtrB [Gammaproteobacteria bacterium]